MKKSLKKGLLAALAWIMILTALPLSPTAAAPGKLGALSVQVKSLTVDRTEQGSRIIAAILLTNGSRETVRVPEYEVRAITTDNIAYTLQPGADNPATIQPLETAELHYSLLVKRSDSFTVTQLNWIQMNKNVYPRVETTVLALAVTQNRMETRMWGQPFALPTGPAQVVLTPAKLHQQTLLDGTGILISFKAENRSNEPQFVPDFLVEGQTDKKKYEAVKASGTPKTTLEPGETRWIHYRLQVDSEEELKNLYIMTQESFRDAGQNAVTYRPAWVKVLIPNYLNKELLLEELPDYRRGEVIPLDPASRVIPKDVEISLIRLQVMPWTTNGLRVIEAEFSIVNRGHVPLPKPEFAVELMSSESRKYLGTLVPKDPPLYKFESEPDMDKTGAINPNVPYAVSFEFHVPIHEIGSEMGIVLSDNITQPPFRLPLASFKTTTLLP